MNTLRQLLAGYAALCVVFAGFIGISPGLHHWAEHGGQGPVHAHSRSTGGLERSLHAHRHSAAPAEHLHHSHTLPEVPETSRVTFANAHPSLSFSSARLHNLWHDLIHRLSEVIADAKSSPTDPLDSEHPHHHTSLSQLLADGWVEFAVDLPRVNRPSSPSQFLGAHLPQRPRPLPWNPQTAGRAPPWRTS